MSLSLVAVFPAAAVNAVAVRRMIITEFAVTLSVAIGISLVVSLTLTPMMRLDA